MQLMLSLLWHLGIRRFSSVCLILWAYLDTYIFVLSDIIVLRKKTLIKTYLQIKFCQNFSQQKFPLWGTVSAICSSSKTEFLGCMWLGTEVCQIRLKMQSKCNWGGGMICRKYCELCTLNSIFEVHLPKRKISIV